MLQNYLKIALRNLFKNKVYSFINIFGLALGLASCIIILLYVSHESSYDKHHEQADRIYRVTSHIDFSGNYLELAPTSAPMGPALLNDYPEVEAMVRLRPRGEYTVKRGDEYISEDGFVFADPSIFEVFTIPLFYGEPLTALEQPNTAAISEEMAQKYFGTTDAVGETITLTDTFDFEVTAVYETMPETSHFRFNFLLSMPTIDEADNTMWLSNNFRTYILLKEGVDPVKFEENFETIKKTYIEPQLQQYMGITFEEFEAAGNRADYRLQPLTNIHLHSDLTGEFRANGSIMYVYIFSGLAFFILLLACINFMNLSTARSSQRAKEVGVRKTLGSARSQLAGQFLLESIVLSIIALGIALFLVELTLPYFSNLAGRTMQVDYFSVPALSGIILGIVIITGLLAGTYPAALLSSFLPVRALKGTFIEQKGHGFFRKGLVVFQFSISIVIIVGLLTINKQLQFIQNKNLGFDKDQIVVVEDAYNIGNSSYAVDDYKEAMMQNTIFETATISSFLPVDGFGRDDRTYWPKGATPSQDNTVNMQRWRVDADYIETLNMEIIEGRNFSEESETDRNTVILNESAAQRFGFENPIGETITIYDSNPDGSINQEVLLDYEIIGIVNNFHYQSLRDNITPLGLFYEPSYGNVAFKISGENAGEAIALLEGEWKSRAGGQPFSYTFLDQRFDQMYRAENRVQNLMSAFSVLAILIACLGLFGLSAYSAEKRSKEIGIRKILGASISSVLGLISKEFLALIALSFVISIPIAWIVMEQWLREFTYRTEIGMDVFVLAGSGTVIIALAAISWQSLKAALMNPVESLRNE
ncbi:MAG: ABC transporter permease [Balneolaceae bacterium]